MVDQFDTLAKRISFLRKKHGLSLAALGQQIGVSAQAVHKWEHGGNVDNFRVEALASLFSVSPAWLLMGDTNTTRGPEVKYAWQPTLPRPASNGTFVPLLDAAEVVSWLTPDDPESRKHSGEWIACPVDHGDRTFAVTVKGVTMENLGSKTSYSEGDVIFADPDLPFRSGSRVLFSANGMAKYLDVLFRQLIIEGDGRYWKALNPQWPQAITPVPEKNIPLAVVIGKWVAED